MPARESDRPALLRQSRLHPAHRRVPSLRLHPSVREWQQGAGSALARTVLRWTTGAGALASAARLLSSLLGDRALHACWSLGRSVARSAHCCGIHGRRRRGVTCRGRGDAWRDRVRARGWAQHRKAEEKRGKRQLPPLVVFLAALLVTALLRPLADWHAGSRQTRPHGPPRAGATPSMLGLRFTRVQRMSESYHPGETNRVPQLEG